MNVVDLAAVGKHPTVSEIEARYLEHLDGETGWGIYGWRDWARFHWVLPRLKPGAAALDVGVFTGQFMDCLIASGLYRRVVGIDVIKKPRFWMTAAAPDVRIVNVAEMKFADRSFETVICMEVLEHLEPEDYPKALRNLRRVAADRLFLSVPFNEQPPLSKNHRRRYGPEDILRDFPAGRYTLLYDSARKRLIWITIEERCGLPGVLHRLVGRFRRRQVLADLRKAADDPEGYCAAAMARSSSRRAS